MSNDQPQLGQARAAIVPKAAFGGILSRVAPAETDQQEPTAPVLAGATALETSVRQTKAAKAKAAPAPAPEQATSEPEPAEEKAAKEKPAKAKTPSTRTKQAPRPAPAADGTKSPANQGVQVSLPVSLDARLKAYKASSGLSHPNILFTAIETVYDQLPDLVRATVAETPTAHSLFSRPSAVVRRASDSEPRNTFIIRITEENKAVLEHLVDQLGAPSRNALLIAAYDAFLPPKN